MTETGQTTPEEHGVVMDVTHARQARRGKHVLWILIVSLVLVVAALFGSWAARAPQLQSADTVTSSQPKAPFQSPEPIARETQ